MLKRDQLNILHGFLMSWWTDGCVNAGVVVWLGVEVGLGVWTCGFGVGVGI